MKTKPFHWKFSRLYLDSRVRRLVDLVGNKRVRDAQNHCYALANTSGGLIPGYPYEIPWCFPLDDPRYWFQTKPDLGISRVLKTLKSPEWLVALTARQISLVGDTWALTRGCIEYQLTGSNAANADVPKDLTDLEYLWWRLEYYFKITPAEPCLFTNELLKTTLRGADQMFRRI